MKGGGNKRDRRTRCSRMRGGVRSSTKPTVSSPLAASAKVQELNRNYRFGLDHVDKVEERIKRMLKKQGLMLAPTTAVDLVDYTAPRFAHVMMMTRMPVQKEYWAAVAELEGARDELREVVRRELA